MAKKILKSLFIALVSFQVVLKSFAAEVCNALLSANGVIFPRYAEMMDQHFTSQAWDFFRHLEHKVDRINELSASDRHVPYDDETTRDMALWADIERDVLTPMIEARDLVEALDGEDPELIEVAESGLADLEEILRGNSRSIVDTLAKRYSPRSKKVVVDLRSIPNTNRHWQVAVGFIHKMLTGLVGMVNAHPTLPSDWEILSEDIEIDEGRPSISSGVQQMRRATLTIKGTEVHRYLHLLVGAYRVAHEGTGGGRQTHYAMMTVAEVIEESLLPFNPGDVEITTQGSRGSGGQHQNTTDSAVRARHIPTQISIRVDTFRSQHRNRDLAFEILRALVHQQRLDEVEAGQRRAWQSTVAEIASREGWVFNVDHTGNDAATFNRVLRGMVVDDLISRDIDWISRNMATHTASIIEWLRVHSTSSGD